MVGTADLVELTDTGVEISRASVGRWLVRLGLNRCRWLDVDGTALRKPGKITARYRDHMVPLDVKKIGRIPDGEGWRAHGRGKASPRQKVGYTYLHTAIDGFSRLAYTEPLPDEKAATVLEFWRNAEAFFADHGITRVITDNGPCYTSELFTRRLATEGITHQRIQPYTPRHNGKVERYNQILAEELLYAHPYQSETEQAQAVAIWNIHYNYHRPHTACPDQPPATQLPTRVTNHAQLHLGLEHLLGTALDHVQEPGAAGALVHGREVDDGGDVLVAFAGVAPHVLIHTQHTHVVEAASSRIRTRLPSSRTALLAVSQATPSA